jgi:APA family basic amino acid/polyamine antiporter
MSSIPAAAETQPRRGKLLQVLGVGFGLAVTVGNTIGAGIVRTPGEVAANLPDAWIFIGVWVVGGLYALLGTAQLTELTAMVRRSGGQYTFARRALGEFPGFLVGWSDFVSVSGTSALVSIVIGEYTAALLPALAGREAWVATAVVLLFGAIQWRGVRWGSGTQNLTAAAKGLAFIALVIACFLLGSRSAGDAAPAAAMPSGLAFAVAMIFALQSVIYTYDGWNGTTYFAEEVEDPDRNIPRAMFGGILSVMGIYVLVNLALVWLLPISAIAGNNFALGAAAGAVFGPLGDPIVRGIMILSMLSGINAYHLMSSRVLFAMSRDGYFTERIVRVNAGGTPTLALGVCVGVALFLIWTNKFNEVLALCALLFVLQYVASFISLFVLRRREPDAPRPYRAWGYPWSTGFVLLGALGFVGGVIASDQRNSLYSLALLAVSYPIYQMLKRANPPQSKSK